MGKITGFIFCLFFCLSFTCRYNQTTIQVGNSYYVINIDSINSYYLVYLKKNDSVFKTVSVKPLIKEKKCNKIQIGSSYLLALHSSIDNLPAGFEYLSPKRNPRINCVEYDDSTSICLEEGMVRDLFFADNLSGLCFIGKVEKK